MFGIWLGVAPTVILLLFLFAEDLTRGGTAPTILMVASTQPVLTSNGVLTVDETNACYKMPNGIVVKYVDTNGKPFRVAFVPVSNHEEEFQTGLSFFRRQDYTNAFRSLCAAANAKHPGAMQTLGFMFENGLAVPKDEEKAFQLYRLSAIKGNPRAMNCLGKMYSLGLGCPTNPVQAEAWHKKAAKSGDGATFDSFGLPTGVVTSESNANAINQSK